MKKKDPDVVYLTRAELKAFKLEEAQARMELVRRVERGEITAREANYEAALIKNPHDWELVNLKEHLEAMAKMFPIDYLSTSRKKNGRRR